MVEYNLTYIDTSNNLFDVMQGINAQLNGYLAPIILFMFFIIMFISMKQYDMKQVLITTSAITTILAGLFWSIGFMAWGYILFPLVIFIGSIIWKGFD